MSPLLNTFGGLSARGFGLTASLKPTPTIDVLVIAGGQNGQQPVYYSGGGGGAGGYRYFTSQAITAGSSYTLTVGGAGNDSSFDSLIFADRDGRGSGTGGNSDGTTYYPNPGSAGNYGGFTPPEGYSGGAASTNGTTAGAGGGAGGAGGNGPTAGGTGVSNSITGTAVTYCVGGGGGDAYTPATVSSTYGSGGGGCGYMYTFYPVGNFPPTSGQNGIIIFRYPTSYRAANVTGFPTVTTNGGYRIYQFTGSGSVIF